MKVFRISYLFVTLMLLMLSCSKGDTPAPPSPPAPTVFRITAIDNAGNKVSGATVTLFTSELSFNLESNSVATKTTDASGIAEFTGLSPIRYWYMAKSTCLNNANGGVSTSNSIAASQTTSLNAVLTPTGTLRMVNNSSNPYRIFVNGTEFPQIPGGGTTNYKYESTGDYRIRVLQVSGFTLVPTDKSYVGTLSCGATLTTTFP